MQFVTAVLSNIGGRKNNEDAVGYAYKENEYGVWVVADGLGGHDCGEVASKIAVDSVINEYETNTQLSRNNIKNILESANNQILKQQEEVTQYKYMRTTIVSMFSDAKSVILGHVGDSRIYKFSQGRIVSQTRDHSVSQVSADAGDILAENIRHDDDRNKLLRVLGADKKLKPEITEIPQSVCEGDVFLLCSDGFWEYVYETEMEIDLLKSDTPDEWINYMSMRILNRVELEHDNFTACAIFIK